MWYKIIVIVIYLCFTISDYATAQGYSYRKYTVNDGLVQSQVTGLFQDSKGYIWISTKGGISRFDGVSFVNFTEQNGLANDMSELFAEDIEGNVWACSRWGLSCFRGLNLTYYPTDLLLNQGVLLIYPGQEGKIEIITHIYSGCLGFAVDYNGISRNI